MNNQLYFKKRGSGVYKPLLWEKTQKSRNNDTTQTTISDRIWGPKGKNFHFLQETFHIYLNFLKLDVSKFS